MNKITNRELEDNSFELMKKIKSRLSVAVHERMEEQNRVGKLSYDEVYEICAYEYINLIKSMNPYCFNSAIEYAKQTSIDPGWRSNRDRLDFYESFNNYLPVWLNENINKTQHKES